MRLEQQQGFPLIDPQSITPRSRFTGPAKALSIALSVSALATLAAALATATAILLPIAAGLLAMSLLCAWFCQRQNSICVEMTPARGAHPPHFDPTTRLFSHTCQHAREAFDWKKRLVENAQKEVILSGNYVGGRAFEEIVDILQRKLETLPDFKACVLGSDLWVDGAMEQRLAALQNTYPDRFVWIVTEKYTHRQKGLPNRSANNHVKALVVDGGRAMVMGGSGLEDKYCYSDGLNRHTGSREGGGLIGGLIARNFRDMDWVFARPTADENTDLQAMPQDAGAQVRHEVLKLGMLYQGINRSQGGQQPQRDLLSLFPAPTGACLFSQPADLAAWNETQLEVMAQGPTDTESLFSRRLTQLIDEARERIVIHHQFFNPSPEIMNALVRALEERHVQVIITSNFDNNGKDSPKAHAAFVPGSRLQMQRLAKRLSPRALRRLKCYEFGGRGSNQTLPRKATLHKKVVVVDRRAVLAGSSNLGHKSCKESTDYEINFLARSRALGLETERLIAEDRQCGERRVARLPSGLRFHAVRHDPMKHMKWTQRLRGWFFLNFMARHCN